MMRKLLIGFILLIVAGIVYFLFKDEPCEGRGLYFEVYYANPKDNLKVYINDKLEYEELFSEEFSVPIHSSESRVIKNYCVNEDSVKVRFMINHRDTIFYVNPDSIQGTYLAATVDGIGYVVFHNHYVGSLRENTPQDWQ